MSISKMINPKNPPRNGPTPWGQHHAEERYKRRKAEEEQKKKPGLYG